MRGIVTLKSVFSMRYASLAARSSSEASICLIVLIIRWASSVSSFFSLGRVSWVSDVEIVTETYAVTKRN